MTLVVIDFSYLLSLYSPILGLQKKAFDILYIFLFLHSNPQNF